MSTIQLKHDTANTPHVTWMTPAQLWGDRVDSVYDREGGRERRREGGREGEREGGRERERDRPSMTSGER